MAILTGMNGDVMGVRVVESYPRGPGWFGRAVTGVSGAGLLVAAVFVALLPMVSGTLIVVDEGDVVDPTRLFDGRVIGVVVLDLVIAAGLTWAGLRLWHGRRRLGLLVRRAGYEPGTATVSEIVAATTYRSWRFLVLDDSSLAGPAPARRWLPVRTAPVVATVAVLGVWWVIGGWTMVSLVPPAFGVAMVVLALAAIVVAAVCVDALVLDPVRLARRPEGIVVDEARLRRLGGRKSGPRLRVASVAPARWSGALAGLAGAGAAGGGRCVYCGRSAARRPGGVVGRWPARAHRSPRPRGPAGLRRCRRGLRHRCRGRSHGRRGWSHGRRADHRQRGGERRPRGGGRPPRRGG